MSSSFTRLGCVSNPPGIDLEPMDWNEGFDTSVQNHGFFRFVNMLRSRSVEKTYETGISWEMRRGDEVQGFGLVRVAPFCTRKHHLIITRSTCHCFNCGYNFNSFTAFTSMIHLELRKHFEDPKWKWWADE